MVMLLLCFYCSLSFVANKYTVYYIIIIFISPVILKVNRGSSLLQVIPIEGSFPVNDEVQKTFAEIFPEIIISK